MSKYHEKVGDYIPVCFEDDPEYELVAGHVDNAAALEAVNNAGRHGPYQEARHVWMRCIPDRTGNYDMLFREAKPGSRGAFRATMLEPR